MFVWLHAPTLAETGKTLNAGQVWIFNRTAEGDVPAINLPDLSVLKEVKYQYRDRHSMSVSRLITIKIEINQEKDLWGDIEQTCHVIWKSIPTLTEVPKKRGNAQVWQ